MRVWCNNAACQHNSTHNLEEPDEGEECLKDGITLELAEVKDDDIYDQLACDSFRKWIPATKAEARAA